MLANFFTPTEANESSHEEKEIITIEDLLAYKNYDQQLTSNYQTILEHFPYANESFVLTLAKHPEIYSDFYNQIHTITNPEDELVLVNKNYALPETYKPSDLVIPNVEFATSAEQNLLKKEAAIALEKMFEAAKTEGVYLFARSGYRSFQTQVQLYNDYVSTYGKEQADFFSARAGHSEHQTGLAIDVTSSYVNYQLDNNFHLTVEGKWIQENAHRFGFIVRYGQGKEALTGFQYEPWHLRYVGVEVATEISNNNWLLEDYLLMHNLIN